MKSRYFTALTLAACLAVGLPQAVHAQKNKPKSTEAQPVAASEPKVDPTQELIKRYRGIYQQALNYNDLAEATDAMYHLISLQPQEVALKDTLAALYFERGAWTQVILVTTDVLEGNPANQGALELRAVANQSVGRAKESLEDYEKLFKAAGNPFHLYEIAALQLNMKRYGECEGSVRQLIANQDLKDKTIAITTADGRSQDVPLQAAALNLYGVLDMDQAKRETAKVHFENAIKAFPDFVLAKSNLEALLKAK